MTHQAPRLRTVSIASPGGPPPVVDLDRDRAKARIEARLLGEEVAPQRVGRFAILEPIGSGGMGLVYAAYDAELDRKVAVKILGPQYDSGNVRRRIVREAQAMAKLNHPHVAQVFEVGEERGRTFIAMEFIRGETLGQWCRRQARTWREVLAVFRDAGSGLAAAHAVGLVHRDFKPDNAMVGDDGRVRVLDFGLARAGPGIEPEVHDDIVSAASAPDLLRTSMTRDGSIMGTPAYMAPEQHLGESVDARADQFSFCVALWEALYRERPFRGTTRATLAAEVTAGRVREPDRSIDVPKWVRRAVERGLAVAPELRFPDMPTLLDALARDPTRRRRRIAVLGGAIAAVAIGFAGHALDRQRRAQACEDDASLSAVWNDGRRTAVRDALAGVGPSYATSTIARVVPHLDDWSSRWQATHAENCVAVDLDARRDAMLAGRVQQCLAEQRQTFESLVGALEAADADVLAGAVESTNVLTDPESCEDERGRDGASVGLVERAWIAESRRILAGARALAATQQTAEAHAITQRLLDFTGAVLPHSSVHAEAMATAAATAGDAEKSAALGERAVLLAIELGAESVAFDATIALVGQLGGPALRERRRWWLALAETIAARLGESQDLRGAAVIEARSRDDDDPRARAADLRAALAIREGILGPEHPLVGTAVADLAVSLEAAGEFDEARALHLRGLAIREQALGPDHPGVGSSLVNVGRIYLARGELSTGQALTERALAIFEESLGPDNPSLSVPLSNLASARIELHDDAGARQLLERSIALVERTQGPQSPYLLTDLVNLSIVSQREGDLEGAATLLGRAIAIASAHGGPFGAGVGAPLLGAAELALTRGRPVEAIGLAERALLALGRVRLDRPNFALCHFTLARALWDGHGDRARAIALARQSLEHYGAMEGDWSDRRGEIERWLAEHPLR